MDLARAIADTTELSDTTWPTLTLLLGEFKSNDIV